MMNQGALPIEVAYALAPMFEMFFYGIYTCLFLSAVPVMFKKKAPRNAHPAWVFLITTIMMYMVSTLHMVLSLYRFLRAYIMPAEPGGPVWYLMDFRRWDYTLNNILLCAVTLMGDALAIYRCYYVWNRSFRIIFLPFLILVTTIGINVYTIYWASHISSPKFNIGRFVALLSSIYPLGFSQNTLTTILIALKIWRQHRTSREAGVVDHGTRISLFQILRIIIESAMVYTLQLLLVIILFFRGDNFQIIVQSAIVPSSGIVFVLIATRVHNAKSKGASGSSESGSIPGWVEEGESGVSKSSAHSSSIPRGWPRAGSQSTKERFETDDRGSLPYAPQNCTSDDDDMK